MNFFALPDVMGLERPLASSRWHWLSVHLNGTRNCTLSPSPLVAKGPMVPVVRRARRAVHARCAATLFGAYPGTRVHACRAGPVNTSAAPIALAGTMTCTLGNHATVGWTPRGPGKPYPGHA